jgi:hypothetical protein
VRYPQAFHIVASLAGMGIFGFLDVASATDTDPLRGFVSGTLRCPTTNTGVARALMTNAEGDGRIVQSTYQYGIPTLVALFSVGPGQKENFIIALDPKTDPNPLGARLAALTRGCFSQDAVLATSKSQKSETQAIRKKKPRRLVSRNRPVPQPNSYSNWDNNYGGCSDFRCALFGRNGR